MIMKIKKKSAASIIGMIIVGLLFATVEIRPEKIHYSTVFTTADTTEVTLHIVLNTFLPVNKEAISKEIIETVQQVNGVKEHSVYTLVLYRTFAHYRKDWKYDTLFCDERGATICCETVRRKEGLLHTE